MPRRTYDERKGRRRRNGQQTDYSEILRDLAWLRGQHRTTTDSRRAAPASKENAR